MVSTTFVFVIHFSTVNSVTNVRAVSSVTAMGIARPVHFVLILEEKSIAIIMAPAIKKAPLRFVTAIQALLTLASINVLVAQTL